MIDISIRSSFRRTSKISALYQQLSSVHCATHCRPATNTQCKIYLFLTLVTAVLRTRRLRWYGHVQRATSCINSITRLGLPGTRDRGRPRKTWSACVRTDMTICNLDGVNPLDKNSWRTSVRRCQVLPTPESGTTAAP